MYTQWLAMEHYRIHVIEDWPEGPEKDAALAAARASLESLERTAHGGASAFVCAVCARRTAGAKLIEYPLVFAMPAHAGRAA